MTAWFKSRVKRSEGCWKCGLSALTRSAGLGADWSGDQQMDQVSKTKGGWTLLKCYLAGTKIDCIKWEVHV